MTVHKERKSSNHKRLGATLWIGETYGTLTNNIECILNILIFNKQPQTIHSFFFNLKIGYDIVQICAHVCKTPHYIDSSKICGKAKLETLYIYSVLFKLPTKTLVIGLVIPTLQHNINSL